MSLKSSAGTPAGTESGRPRQPLRSPGDLIAAGLAAPQARADLEAVAAHYAIAVTPAMENLIDPADPADPIARQFVPSRAELLRRPGESADPIGDDLRSPLEGLVHRYPDRVLLKIVQVCPVYCRFCFRRERVGPGKGVLSEAALEAALAYIAASPDIWEVIVTGGDPLILPPGKIAALMARLDAVAHVKIVRFHSRVPVVDPARIGPAMAAALSATSKTVYVAVHANHPRELTPQARAVCLRLAKAGVVLVSQSVLLRGVNDDVETLAALMRAFVEARVKPYYLHHPDLAPGTGHFRLSIEEGQALVSALRGHVSGLAQPAYVLDIPGGHGKAPLTPAAVSGCGDHVEITDFRGRRHAYSDDKHDHVPPETAQQLSGIGKR